jgi:hypothetical protein
MEASNIALYRLLIAIFFEFSCQSHKTFWGYKANKKSRPTKKIGRLNVSDELLHIILQKSAWTESEPAKKQARGRRAETSGKQTIKLATIR